MQTILDNTFNNNLLENDISDDLLSTPPTLLQDPWTTPAPPALQFPSLNLDGLQPTIVIGSLPIDDIVVPFQDIQGTDGNDNIQGSNKDDIIYGRDGNDTIESYEGIDALYGGKGDDRIYNGWGDSYLYGEDDNDYLHGGGGEDELWGGEGDDTLSGSWDNDRLYGGAGDDILQGSHSPLNGSEIDILTGDYTFSRPGATFLNEGADTFVLDFYYYDALHADLRAHQGIMPNGDGYAIITDFTRSEGDRIQVMGSASDYQLQIGYDFTRGEPYTDILYKGERVGIAQGVNNLSLTADFNFV